MRWFFVFAFCLLAVGCGEKEEVLPSTIPPSVERVQHLYIGETPEKRATAAKVLSADDRKVVESLESLSRLAGTPFEKDLRGAQRYVYPVLPTDTGILAKNAVDDGLPVVFIINEDAVLGSFWKRLLNSKMTAGNSSEKGRKPLVFVQGYGLEREVLGILLLKEWYFYDSLIRNGHESVLLAQMDADAYTGRLLIQLYPGAGGPFNAIKERMRALQKSGVLVTKGQLVVERTVLGQQILTVMKSVTNIELGVLVELGVCAAQSSLIAEGREHGVAARKYADWVESYNKK